MRQKCVLLLKLAFIWLMSAGILGILVCREIGQNLSLLIFDIKTGFVDNPALPMYFRDKLIYPSLVIIFLALFILFIKDFRLKFGLGKWKTELGLESEILRWASNLCLAAATLCFMCAVIIFVKKDLHRTVREGWDGDLLIAHAGGRIEETDYTNSVEAFEQSYQKGIRTMEIDFSLTSDDRFVCVHEWGTQMNSNHEAGYVYSEQEFMNIQVFDSFTPMSLETLFELMRKYEDTWIVTDTKGADWETIKKEFEILVDTAERTDSLDLLDRFVVQLYNYDMYGIVDQIYPFPSYILTLYRMMGNPEEGRITEYCRFCKNMGVDSITMWSDWATPEVMSVAEFYGIDIYVHTVNEVESLKRSKGIGVKGFYTDCIFPENLEED